MLNNISIIGRLTKDPEVRKTTTGRSVCTFTIANERPKNSQGEKEVDFLEVVAWNSSADFVGNYFKKGSPILVTGRVQTKTWKDKEGNNRQSWNIVTNTVEFVPTSKKQDEATEYIPTEGELPF